MKRLVVFIAMLIVFSIWATTAFAAVPGWPGTTGTPSGTFQCSKDGVILTSADDANLYGAYDFGATGGTFAQMGDGGNYTVLSGAVGGGAPRLSVFLANGDLWYVYLYQVPGAPSVPSFEDSTNNPGVYVSWDAAMEVDGTQPVNDAILVVDTIWNGVGISIDAQGLACGGNVATMPPPNHVFLCYSTFETDAGMTVTPIEAESLLASKTDHYFLPNAVLGNVDGGTNVGTYHLQCNAPGTLTGFNLGDDPEGGPQIITAAEAAVALLGGSPGYYPIISK